MVKRLGLFSAIMILIAVPARGDQPPVYSQYGEAPGLFGWVQSPSVVCRDGAARPDTAALAPAPQTGAQPQPRKPDPASATSGTAFTFSGNAYAGVAVRF